jgi:hypothetical protein
MHDLVIGLFIHRVEFGALLNLSMNGKKSPHPSPLPKGEGIGILAPFSLGRRAGLRRERSAERDEGQSLLHSATPNLVCSFNLKQHI